MSVFTVHFCPKSCYRILIRTLFEKHDLSCHPQTARIAADLSAAVSANVAAVGPHAVDQLYMTDL